MIVVERSDLDRDALARLAPRREDQADDGFDYRGVTVAKPWGHEAQLHRGGAVSVWRLTLRAGAETSMHCHPGKRTALIVESGEAVLHTLTRRYDLRAGDFVHIEAGAFHRTETARGAVLLEVESPPVKRDLVRLSDVYGRQGQGYEKCA